MIGTKISITECVGPLFPDTAYYFLHRNNVEGIVLLVFFSDRVKNNHAHLVVVDGVTFDDALGDRIRIEKERIAVPPWNLTKAGRSVASLDKKRKGRKRANKHYIDARLKAISPAIEQTTAWLNSKDPVGALNRIARQFRKNETRFRTQVLSYLICGKNLLALLPPFHKSGTWQRAIKSVVKQGCPSRSMGRSYGSKEIPALTEKYLEGYWKFQRPGRPLTEIYRLINAKLLKIQVAPGSTKYQRRFVSSGIGFYTYEQFRYRLGKKYGLATIQINRYGAVRQRNRLSLPIGAFVDGYTNLMQKVVADAYTVSEHPKGYIEGTVLPPLKSVEIVDCLSGLITGTGFSLGAERSVAYRMALFCMAVPKPYFCSLFGISITPEEWPSEGLPLEFGTDGGAGRIDNLIQETDGRIASRSVSPSYTPQSNASIEAAHPKNTKLGGAPQYTVSNLTTAELIRKEIRRVIVRNMTARAEGRIVPTAEMVDVPPSPIAIWEYYAERFRNVAVPISLGEAVRSFLEPETFTVKCDGIYYKSRAYSSKKLEGTAIFRRRMSQKDEIEVTGYMMSVCLRNIWIEYDGELFQLTAKSIRDAENRDYEITVVDIDNWNDRRAIVESEFRQTQQAAPVEGMQSFERETGRSWDSARPRRGRYKLTQEAKEEALEADKNFLRPGGRKRRSVPSSSK